MGKLDRLLPDKKLLPPIAIGLAALGSMAYTLSSPWPVQPEKPADEQTLRQIQEKIRAKAVGEEKPILPTVLPEKLAKLIGDWYDKKKQAIENFELIPIAEFLKANGEEYSNIHATLEKLAQAIIHGDLFASRFFMNLVEETIEGHAFFELYETRWKQVPIVGDMTDKSVILHDVPTTYAEREKRINKYMLERFGITPTILEANEIADSLSTHLYHLKKSRKEAKLPEEKRTVPSTFFCMQILMDDFDELMDIGERHGNERQITDIACHAAGTTRENLANTIDEIIEYFDKSADLFEDPHQDEECTPDPKTRTDLKAFANRLRTEEF